MIITINVGCGGQLKLDMSHITIKKTSEVLPLCQKLCMRQLVRQTDIDVAHMGRDGCRPQHEWRIVVEPQAAGGYR